VELDSRSQKGLVDFLFRLALHPHAVHEVLTSLVHPESEALLPVGDHSLGRHCCDGIIIPTAVGCKMGCSLVTGKGNMPIFADFASSIGTPPVNGNCLGLRKPSPASLSTVP